MNTTLTLLKGDLTTIIADAIVNAANTTLLGGGGVDGAIHRMGGTAILEECIKIRNRQGGCKVGEAVITTAGKLPATWVIHTVGPVWNGGNNGERELLANCYRNSLLLAVKHNSTTIAFPNISTGVYHFPRHEAAPIAIGEVKKFIAANDSIREIMFVCFDDGNYDIYSKLLDI